MPCISPISVPDKILGHYRGQEHRLLVPCGHCVECARARRNDWFVRLWSVWKRYESLGLPVWFVTITIDPKLWPNHNVVTNPNVDELVTPFIRSWNERLRYLMGGKMPLRFLCSEFGKPNERYVDHNGVERFSTGALHFHGLLFGYLPVEKLKDGFKSTHGHVDIERIRSSRGIRYIVKYATKDYSITNPRLRARTFCSPGIGDPMYYFGNSPATNVVIINGYHYRTPRYFIDRQWLNVYASTYCGCSRSVEDALKVARKSFYDPFGHSAIVLDNAEKRRRNFDLLLDELDRVDFSDPSVRNYYLEKAKKVASQTMSYFDVNRLRQLCSLKRIGPGHPVLRAFSLRSLEHKTYDLMFNNKSFQDVKPFNLPFIKFLDYEGHQTFLSLS